MNEKEMFWANCITLYQGIHCNGRDVGYGWSFDPDRAQEKARKDCWDKTIAANPEYWKQFVEVKFLGGGYD